MASYSLNELHSMVLKACLGARVARGVAQDMAAALVERAGAGDDCGELLHALSEALDHHKEPVTNRFALNRWRRGWQGGDARVLHHGCSIVDHAILSAGEGSVDLSSLDHPHLLDALVRASGYVGACKGLSHGGMSVSLRHKRNVVSHMPVARIAIDPKVWARLGAHAHLTMVPNDEASKADAGAGSTDND